MFDDVRDLLRVMHLDNCDRYTVDTKKYKVRTIFM